MGMKNFFMQYILYVIDVTEIFLKLYECISSNLWLLGIDYNDQILFCSEENSSVAHIWQGYSSVCARNFPTLNQVNVIKVSLGVKHCAFLTDKHILYSFGQNQFGQLGTGDVQDYSKEPVQVKEFAGMSVF